jgi:hypothetical protein
MKKTLLIAAAAVLGLAANSFALTLNPSNFAGPVSIDIDNWEVSPNYGYTFDSFEYTLADDSNNDGNIADDKALSGPANSWGIFEVNSITDIDNEAEVFDQGFGGQYVAGVFYGIKDTHVKWSGISLIDNDSSGDVSDGDGGTATLEVEGTDLTFDLYVLPAENWDAGNGPGVGGPGSYPGITDQGKLPDLKATSAVNHTNISTLGNVVEYYSKVDFGLIYDGDLEAWVPISANGDFRSVLDAVDGENVEQWDHDWVFNLSGPDNDLTIAGNLTLPSSDWDFKSDDPVETFVTPIPEPLTMGAFGLAFAGLSGYIRKRRNA